MTDKQETVKKLLDERFQLEEKLMARTASPKELHRVFKAHIKELGNYPHEIQLAYALQLQANTDIHIDGLARLPKDLIDQLVGMVPTDVRPSKISTEAMLKILGDKASPRLQFMAAAIKELPDDAWDNGRKILEITRQAHKIPK